MSSTSYRPHSFDGNDEEIGEGGIGIGEGCRPTACLFTKKGISSQIFSKGFKLIFQNICFPNQFQVAASIKRWPNPLETTGWCSI